MSHGGNVWQGAGPRQWQDHSANLRPEGMPEWTREALRSAIELAEYYPEPNADRAAEALAEFLGVPAGRVLVTAGGISALDLVTELGPRELVLPVPCFCEYEELARRHGVPVKKVNILSGTRIFTGAFDEAVAEGAELRLCNPINPVGAAFSRAEVIRLADICAARGARLTVDEAFIDLCPENSVRDLVGEYEGLTVCGSLTKLLAIPGVRAGYICASEGIIERLRARRLTWEVSCFAEAVILAMPERAGEIRAYAGLNRARREAMRAQLEALGMRVYPSEANFLLIDTGADAGAIAGKLKEKNILVRECRDFDGINEGRHLRVAVRAEQDNARLIEALREATVCAENL